MDGKAGGMNEFAEQKSDEKLAEDDRETAAAKAPMRMKRADSPAAGRRPAGANLAFAGRAPECRTRRVAPSR